MVPVCRLALTWTLTPLDLLSGPPPSPRTQLTKEASRDLRSLSGAAAALAEEYCAPHKLGCGTTETDGRRSKAGIGMAEAWRHAGEARLASTVKAESKEPLLPSCYH
jgi:hypothetical protein